MTVDVRFWYNHSIMAYEVVLSHRARWSDGAVDIEILQPLHEHKTFGFITSPDGTAPQPSFTITKQSAQAVFDSLWEGGMRPTDSGSVNGEQNAIKDALNRERQLLDQVLGAALRKPA